MPPRCGLGSNPTKHMDTHTTQKENGKRERKGRVEKEEEEENCTTIQELEERC